MNDGEESPEGCLKHCGERPLCHEQAFPMFPHDLPALEGLKQQHLAVINA